MKTSLKVFLNTASKVFVIRDYSGPHFPLFGQFLRRESVGKIHENRFKSYCDNLYCYSQTTIPIQSFSENIKLFQQVTVTHILFGSFNQLFQQLILPQFFQISWKKIFYHLNITSLATLYMLTGKQYIGIEQSKKTPRVSII